MLRGLPFGGQAGRHRNESEAANRQGSGFERTYGFTNWQQRFRLKKPRGGASKHPATAVDNVVSYSRAPQAEYTTKRRPPTVVVAAAGSCFQAATVCAPAPCCFDRNGKQVDCIAVRLQAAKQVTMKRATIRASSMQHEPETPALLSRPDCRLRYCPQRRRLPRCNADTQSCKNAVFNNAVFRGAVFRGAVFQGAVSRLAVFQRIVRLWIASAPGRSSSTLRLSPARQLYRPANRITEISVIAWNSIVASKTHDASHRSTFC